MLRSHPEVRPHLISNLSAEIREAIAAIQLKIMQLLSRKELWDDKMLF